MERNGVRSSGAMWYAILAAWGVGTALPAWRVGPYLPSFPSSLVLVFLLVCLSYFVLTGVFNVVVNVTSHMLRAPPAGGGATGRPRVAVLYCTYDDFDRESAGSLLDLTYENLEIWVLDDSTRPEARAELDASAARTQGGGVPVQLLRRADRRGFKAGAINEALRRLAPEVQYVAIADADERLATDFVEGAPRHFPRDGVAF